MKLVSVRHFLSSKEFFIHVSCINTTSMCFWLLELVLEFRISKFPFIIIKRKRYNNNTLRVKTLHVSVSPTENRENRFLRSSYTYWRKWELFLWGTDILFTFRLRCYNLFSLLKKDGYHYSLCLVLPLFHYPLGSHISISINRFLGYQEHHALD